MGGEIPYRDYTFILHLRANAGGGLEHANSTALGYPRFGFTGGKRRSLNFRFAESDRRPRRTTEAFFASFLMSFFISGM